MFNLPTKGLISILTSIAKESKKPGAKKLNKAIFVDEGLTVIYKKIEKGISSITGSEITLTNQTMK